MKNTKKLTLSAILAALSVVLLMLGTLLSVADLTALLITSFIVLFALLSVSGVYPWLLYAVTGVLSLILVPDKLIPLLYIVFAGVYPLLKFRLDRLPRVLSWTLKELWFNATLVGGAALSLFVLSSGDAELPVPLLIAGFFVMNACFILFDITLKRFVRIYFNRIEPRVSRLLK